MFFGGLSIKKDEEVLKRNCPHVVVGTPGRILALVRNRSLNLKNVKHFVLDECDKMLEQLGECLRRVCGLWRPPASSPELQSQALTGRPEGSPEWGRVGGRQSGLLEADLQANPGIWQSELRLLSWVLEWDHMAQDEPCLGTCPC